MVARWLGFAPLIVGLSAILAGCATVTLSLATPSPAPSPVSAGDHIGSIVTDGSWRYRVLQVDTADTIPISYDTLTAKGHWVVVLLELTNLGKENFSINSHDFELRDDKGIKYAMADFDSLRLAGDRKQVRLGEQFPPTVPLRTTFLFDVAPGTTGMQLWLRQPNRLIGLY